MNHYNPILHGSPRAWSERSMRHKPVVKAVKAVVKAVTNVVTWVGNTVAKVVDTVGSVISNALKDPIGTIATIAAVATGNAWAIPLINGANTAIKGGDLMDVFKSVATSAIAQNIAPVVGSKVNASLSSTLGKSASTIVASGVAGASAAIVTGQDPLKAFLAGGINAAVPAALGEIDKSTGGAFKALPETAQTVIESAVKAQLAGGNVTATVMNGVLRNSAYVTNTLNELGIKGDQSKLSVGNQAILADILYNTASVVATGGDASGVVQKAINDAGSKAFAQMAGDQFNKVTGRVVEVYNSMSGQVDLIRTNEASQNAIISQYNTLKGNLDKENTKLTGLQTNAQNLVAQWNSSARTDKALLEKTNAAVKSYQDFAADLNTRYTNDYAPKFKVWEDQMKALDKTHEKAVATYDVLNQDYASLANELKTETDKVATTVIETTVSGIDPKFNAKEYAAINNLDASVDPYTHWITTGKNQGLYTNLSSANADIDAKQANLIQSVAKSMGLDVNQLTSKDVMALNQKIVDRYGNNLNALNTAKPSDITGTLTKEQLFADSAKAGFKGDLNATVYGAWNSSAATIALPEGVKLASKEDYLAGKAKQGVDAKGNVYSYVPDPAYKSNTWTVGTDGNLTIKTDPVYITDSSKGIESAVSKAFTLATFGESKDPNFQDAINAAINLTTKAKAAGNTNAITNTTLDAATKAESLKRDITTIFDFGKTNGVSVDGPNSALFGDKLQGPSGTGVPITTLGPLTNKYSFLGYGGTFHVKDLTNDRVYTMINVGNSTILRDAATNIEITLTPDQAKVFKGQIAGGTAKNLDTVPSAGDISKMAAGRSAANGKSLTENTDAINKEINAGTTTLAEAKDMLTKAGYTNPTDAEAQQFVTIRKGEADSKTDIDTWANPKVTSTEEAAQYFKEIGYIPTQQEIDKFVGKIEQTKSKTDIGTYTAPLMVTEDEVKDALKKMGITKPDPEDVKKLTGQYNETLLQGKIDPNKADIQFRSLQYQLNTMSGGDTDAIGSNYAGPTAADVTEIQRIMASGGSGAADLKYDYNGDGKVDGTDLGAVQGYMGGTGGAGTGTGTGVGTGFTPGKGTIWDKPTGIYKTIADNQTLTEKKIAEEAEKTRLAQKEQWEAADIIDKERQKQYQQQTNFGQLVNMLGQSEDLGGQKVTVNQSPLTQINNVYDWSSIFGTPQQEKMFVTPYASGGTVDDLVKILKG